MPAEHVGFHLGDRIDGDTDDDQQRRAAKIERYVELG
jgi:hypothetical protein